MAGEKIWALTPCNHRRAIKIFHPALTPHASFRRDEHLFMLESTIAGSDPIHVIRVFYILQVTIALLCD